jgi:hypothetical protein
MTERTIYGHSMRNARLPTVSRIARGRQTVVGARPLRSERLSFGRCFVFCQNLSNGRSSGVALPEIRCLSRGKSNPLAILLQSSMPRGG